MEKPQERNKEMKILIIEDKSEKYIDIVMTLKSEGWSNVEKAGTVEEAMDKIVYAMDSAEPYDIVITDMHYPPAKGMPPIGDAGEKLIQEIKEKDIHLPVIVCSSHNYSLPAASAFVWYRKQGAWKRELIQAMKDVSR